jgi:hypothetical protein
VLLIGKKIELIGAMQRAGRRRVEWWERSSIMRGEFFPHEGLIVTNLRIRNWLLTILQHWLVKTGGCLVKHTR